MAVGQDRKQQIDFREYGPTGLGSRNHRDVVIVAGGAIPVNWQML